MYVIPENIEGFKMGTVYKLNEDELLMPELFHNKMVTLREICDEVEKDMDRESTE